jgi:hypothetical protein
VPKLKIPCTGNFLPSLRDIDFAARAFENSGEKVLSAGRTIASIPLDDGTNVVIGKLSSDLL